MTLPLLRAMLVACLALGALPRPADAAEAERALTFDFTHAHRWEGFGFQVWISKEFPDARQTVLKDLNVRWVRMGPPSAIPGGDLRPGLSVTQMLAAFRPPEPAVRAATTEVLSQLNSLGILVHLVVWEMPHEWRLEKRWADAKGEHVGRKADVSHQGDYANYVAANVLNAQRAGMHVAFVEPANEPEGTWNTHWTPEEYAAFMPVLRHALDASGLQSVGIEAPGSGDTKVAPPFLRTLRTSGAVRDLAAFSTHDWGTRIAPDPVGMAEDFRREIAAMPARLPIFITEFNDENPRWKAPPFDGGPEQRSPAIRNNSVDSTDFAVAVAAEGLKLIADGAAGISFWQIQDLDWSHNSLGMIDLKGRIRPSEAAFRSFLSLAAPGSSVVGASPGNPDMVAAAFRSGAATTIAAINLSDRPVVVQPRLTGDETAPATGRKLRIGAEQDFLAVGPHPGPASSGIASMAGGALTLHLPPHAVVGVSLVP